MSESPILDRLERIESDIVALRVAYCNHLTSYHGPAPLAAPQPGPDHAVALIPWVAWDRLVAERDQARADLSKSEMMVRHNFEAAQRAELRASDLQRQLNANIALLNEVGYGKSVRR